MRSSTSQMWVALLSGWRRKCLVLRSNACVFWSWFSVRTRGVRKENQLDQQERHSDIMCPCHHPVWSRDRDVILGMFWPFCVRPQLGFFLIFWCMQLCGIHTAQHERGSYYSTNIAELTSNLRRAQLCLSADRVSQHVHTKWKESRRNIFNRYLESHFAIFGSKVTDHSIIGIPHSEMSRLSRLCLEASFTKTMASARKCDSNTRHVCLENSLPHHGVATAASKRHLHW